MDFTKIAIQDAEIPVARPSTNKDVEAVTPLVKSLSADRTKAVQVGPFPAPEDVAAVLRAVDKAAKNVGVTIRRQKSEDGKSVTVWAIDRQSRPGAGRKPKDETPVEDAKTAAK